MNLLLKIILIKKIWKKNCEVNNNNIQKKDEKSKYIILNNKFFIIDMNPIFPQNNCPPKEPNEETKDASIKEKKE